MEQELRFGLDLGRMADFPAFIASKSFDLWNHHIPQKCFYNLWHILMYQKYMKLYKILKITFVDQFQKITDFFEDCIFKITFEDQAQKFTDFFWRLYFVDHFWRSSSKIYRFLMKIVFWKSFLTIKFKNLQISFEDCILKITSDDCF